MIFNKIIRIFLIYSEIKCILFLFQLIAFDFRVITMVVAEYLKDDTGKRHLSNSVKA